MVAVELLVAGLIVMLVVVLARLVWVIGRRREAGPVTEAQARENAAPLSTAILVSDPRERTGVAAAAEAREQAVGIETDLRSAARTFTSIVRGHRAVLLYAGSESDGAVPPP